jgi:hypothetical protein
MRHITILSALLIITFTSLIAQSKKEIREAGIKKRTVKEIVYEKGLTTPMIEEENRYDSKGNLIEIREINSLGKITNWMKYEYDADDNITSEITLDVKGKLVSKVVYVYKDGLRKEKLYYNALGRLVKKKVYEYVIN